MKKVREVLAAKGSQVYSLGPDATVFEALKMMAEKEVGALVVIDADKLVGILSERDYARKVIMRGKASHDTLVREIMSSDVRTADPERPISECMGLMADHQVPSFARGRRRAGDRRCLRRRSREGNDGRAGADHPPARLRREP